MLVELMPSGALPGMLSDWTRRCGFEP